MKTILDIINAGLAANEHNDSEYNAWFTMLELAGKNMQLHLAAHDDSENAPVYLQTARTMLDGAIAKTSDLPTIHGTGRSVTIRMERRPLARIADRFTEGDYDNLYMIMHRVTESVIGVMLYADDGELNSLRDQYLWAASVCVDLENARNAFDRLTDAHEITFTASPYEIYVLQNEIAESFSRFGFEMTLGEYIPEIGF